MVAGPEARPLGAAYGDLRLARLDQEERRSVGALLDHGLTGGEVALLEEERDLRQLVVVEIGEQRDAPQRVGRALRPSASANLRHGAALEQVERIVGDRPFDVSVGAVGVLAAARELVERVESATSSRQSRSTSSGATSCSTVPPPGRPRIAIRFSPGATLAHLPVAGDAIAVRDYKTGDDRLSEAPARLDHPFVSSVDRVAREHHARALRVEQHLHDDRRRSGA